MVRSGCKKNQNESHQKLLLLLNRDSNHESGDLFTKSQIKYYLNLKLHYL